MATADSADLDRPLEEELTQLKTRIDHVERSVAAMRASDMLEQARRSHADPNWFAAVREQYSQEVTERTLELNEAFPAADE